MAEALPCATLSRALAEPLYGTASRVRGWVLLEQPGPWGREAVLESRLEPALRQVLDADRLTPADLAGHLDGPSRLVLVRRLVREGLLQPTAVG